MKRTLLYPLFPARHSLVLSLVILLLFSPRGYARGSFEIYVENREGGIVKVITPDGELNVGSVVRPSNTVNREGFHASVWGKDSAVAATAVNAIHVRVAENHDNPEEPKGIVFSILPREMLVKTPENYSSYISPSSSIFTDIQAGATIFGGGFSPYVGNRVEVVRNGSRSALNPDYVPAINDILIVSAKPPERSPIYIRLENAFGGIIYIKYAGEEERPLGQVLKPVAGVGRFEGSTYAEVGRIRANHPGVLDISTSPYGIIGGFQIIPRHHAMSTEMERARLLTQWLVIGPLNALDPSWEGREPFFFGYFRPSYVPLRTEPPHPSELLDRFLVQVRIKGGEWTRMPSIRDRQDEALKDITEIRILFPVD